MLQSDEQGFRKAIQADLNDWLIRLVFADWLEEQGRVEEADGQRWQFQYRKYPSLNYEDKSREATIRRGYFVRTNLSTGWCVEYCDDCLEDTSTLAVDIFDKLSVVYKEDNLSLRIFRYYTSVELAEQDLAKALTAYYKFHPDKAHLYAIHRPSMDNTLTVVR